MQKLICLFLMSLSLSAFAEVQVTEKPQDGGVTRYEFSISGSDQASFKNALKNFFSDVEITFKEPKTGTAFKVSSDGKGYFNISDAFLSLPDAAYTRYVNQMGQGFLILIATNVEVPRVVEIFNKLNITAENTSAKKVKKWTSSDRKLDITCTNYSMVDGTTHVCSFKIKTT